VRLILCISSDQFLLQCFDTVGWAMQLVKIVPKRQFVVCVGWDVKPYSLTAASLLLYIARILVGSSRLDTTHWTCRAVLFDKLDTAKMHGLDTSNVSCRAKRDATRQVEFGLMFVLFGATLQIQ